MTLEHITVRGMTDDENRTLNRLLDQLAAKRPRNELRRAYYDAKHVIRSVGTLIPPQYYRMGVVLGWSAKAVDLLARRCNLDGFVWPDGTLGDIGATEVWEANRLGVEMVSAGVSSLIHGVAFLINTSGDPAEGEPASLIHVKDALNATGEWNHRRRGLDNLVSINTWDEEGRPAALTLYLWGETISAERGSRGWEVTHRSRHPWGVPAEAMVYKYRIGREFGSSRISRPVMSHQDLAVRAAIRMEGHMDIYSFPDVWLLGGDESLFTNPDGSVKPAWKVMMGRIKGIPDDPDRPDNDPLARADVKHFGATSPQPHIEMLRQQAQLFSGETSIPLTSLGVSDMSNPVSSDSYVASREDLIAEAEGTTDGWSPAVSKAFIRALAIANDLAEIPPEWSTIAAKWRSPMYLSRAAQADAGVKQLSAVPWLAETEVGLELLGLSEQQIARALADKQRAESRMRLNALAQAARALQPELAADSELDDGDEDAE